MSSEWVRADVSFCCWLSTITRMHRYSWTCQISEHRLGLGQVWGGPSLTLETDANGALIKTWNDAIFLGLSDDIRLDWYQTYGWLDSEIGVVQRLQAD